MKTKGKTLREKLEKIIFDWIPCDNNRMKRQPDENKISLVLDLFSQQKQEAMEEGIEAGLERAMDILNQYPEANVYEPRLDIEQEIIKHRVKSQTKTN